MPITPRKGWPFTSAVSMVTTTVEPEDAGRYGVVQAEHGLRLTALHSVVGDEMQEVGLGGSYHRTTVRGLLLIIE